MVLIKRRRLLIFIYLLLVVGVGTSHISGFNRLKKTTTNPHCWKINERLRALLIILGPSILKYDTGRSLFSNETSTVWEFSSFWFDPSVVRARDCEPNSRTFDGEFSEKQGAMPGSEDYSDFKYIKRTIFSYCILTNQKIPLKPFNAQWYCHQSINFNSSKLSIVGEGFHWRDAIKCNRLFEWVE